MGNKKRNPKKIALALVSFTLGASMIIGGGHYKNSLKKEAPSFKASFEKENQVFTEFVYDIKNQGFPKKLVQPGKISVTTGYSGGIVNNTDKPVMVNVRTEGLTGEYELKSTDSSFDKKEKKFIKPLEPGKSLSLNVDLNIPRSSVNNNYIISQGKVIFEDANDGTILGTLPVKIINSENKV